MKTSGKRQRKITRGHDPIFRPHLSIRCSTCASQVRNRTILHSALPAVAIHLASQQPLTREELIYALETTLALNNIAVVEDGEKFVQAVPIYLVSQVQARAPKPKPGQPAGSFNLPSTSLEQMLAIYAKTRNRTVLRPAAIPLVMVQLACQQSLTQEEAVYALETILLLHNFTVVEDGEKVCAGGSHSTGVTSSSKGAQAETGHCLDRACKSAPVPPFIMGSPNAAPSCSSQGKVSDAYRQGDGILRVGLQERFSRPRSAPRPLRTTWTCWLSIMRDCPALMRCLRNNLAKCLSCWKCGHL